MNERKSLTGFLPLFFHGRKYLQIVPGESLSHLRDMCRTIDAHRGTPQSTANWSDPEDWILERLCGDSRRIAWRLWRESGGLINPANLKGLKSLCQTHSLLSYWEDEIVLNRAGKRFLDNDKDFIFDMDEYEGIMIILREVAVNGPGESREFLSSFRNYCRKYTTRQSHTSISTSLTARLMNLCQRSLVHRDHREYSIADKGIKYIERTRLTN